MARGISYMAHVRHVCTDLESFLTLQQTQIQNLNMPSTGEVFCLLSRPTPRYVNVTLWRLLHNAGDSPSQLGTAKDSFGLKLDLYLLQTFIPIQITQSHISQPRYPNPYSPIEETQMIRYLYPFHHNPACFWLCSRR